MRIQIDLDELSAEEQQKLWDFLGCETNMPYQKIEDEEKERCFCCDKAICELFNQTCDGYLFCNDKCENKYFEQKHTKSQRDKLRSVD